MIAFELFAFAVLLVGEFVVDRGEFLFASATRELQAGKQLRMLVLNMLIELGETTRAGEFPVIDAAEDRRRMHQQNVRQTVVFLEISHRAVGALPHSFIDGIISVAHRIFVVFRAESREAFCWDQMNDVW
jgi:DNA helicase IV